MGNCTLYRRWVLDVRVYRDYVAHRKKAIVPALIPTYLASARLRYLLKYQHQPLDLDRISAKTRTHSKTDQFGYTQSQNGPLSVLADDTSDPTARFTPPFTQELPLHRSTPRRALLLRAVNGGLARLTLTAFPCYTAEPTKAPRPSCNHTPTSGLPSFALPSSPFLSLL